MKRFHTIFAAALILVAQAGRAEPAAEAQPRPEPAVADVAKPKMTTPAAGYAEPREPEQQPVASPVQLIRDAVIAEALTLVPEAQPDKPIAAAASSAPAAHVLTAHRRIRVAAVTAATATFVIEDAVELPGASEPLSYVSHGVPVSVLLEPGAEFSLDGLNLTLAGGARAWSVAAEGGFFPWVSKRDKGALRIGTIEIKPTIN